MTKTIKFGTDGWRAVIGDAYTFDNVARVSAATARALKDHAKKTKNKSKQICVGYDHRFLSSNFAEVAAKVLQHKGYNVRISSTPVSTPAVSLWVKEKKALAGVEITASHNPASHNGFKLKVFPGMSASAELTKIIESYLPAKAPTGWEGQTLISEDLRTRHVRKLKRTLNIALLKKSGLKLGVDSMYGTGGRMIEELLAGGKTKVTTLHGERDPAFGGTPPEPTAERVKELSRLMRAKKLDLGIATDGDADRIAFVDPSGKFISAQEIMAILGHDFLVRKGKRQPLAKTYAATEWLDRIAEKAGQKCFVTPVGFKYVADLMLSENVLMGGEESGGIGVSSYLLERDGVVIGLMVAQIMAERKMSLSALIKELAKLYGPLVYKRLDVPSDPTEGKSRLKKLAKKKISKLPGYVPAVSRIETLDGVKLFFEDGAWLLFRQSGTEALLRTYAEAPSVAKLGKLFKAGVKLFHSIRT